MKFMFAYVLYCLAYAGHSRRVQSQKGRSPLADNTVNVLAPREYVGARIFPHHARGRTVLPTLLLALSNPHHQAGRGFVSGLPSKSKQRKQRRRKVIPNCKLVLSELLAAGNNDDKIRVSVVGAGAAGIAAALSLARRGFAVTLVDAGSRLGGRISTFNESGIAYDLGASWLHGRDSTENPLWEFAHAFDIPSPPKTPHVLHYVDGSAGEAVSEDAVGQHIDAYEKALTECTKSEHVSRFEDVASAVKKIVGEPEGEMSQYAHEWRAQRECTISGCDSVADLDLPSWDEYEEPKGLIRVASRWRGGYRSLLDAAVAELHERSVDVRLDHRVTSIKWDGEHGLPRVTCDTSDGTLHLESDHIIVTASLGVLKDSVAGTGLQFQPPLPAKKRDAVQRLGFGTVDKVVLLYDRPWWQDMWTSLRILWSDKDKHSQGDPSWLPAVHCFAAPPNVCGLECWLSGPGARAMELDTDDAVIDALHSLLVRSVAAADLPRPVGMIRSSWGKDSNFQGSYSFVAVGASGDDIDELASAADENCTLLFAGEHTHRTYYSTVHGALWSGLKAADKLVAHHVNEGSLIEPEVRGVVVPTRPQNHDIFHDDIEEVMSCMRYAI